MPVAAPPPQVDVAVIESRVDRVEADVVTLRERVHDHGQRLQLMPLVYEGHKALELRVGAIERSFAELKGRLTIIGAVGIVAVPVLTTLLGWLLEKVM